MINSFIREVINIKTIISSTFAIIAIAIAVTIALLVGRRISFVINFLGITITKGTYSIIGCVRSKCLFLQ